MIPRKPGIGPNEMIRHHILRAFSKTCPIAVESGSHDVEMHGSESDRELLGRYSAGGGDAPFRVLVDRYSGLVFHTAQRLLGDHALAQDVSQRVFVSLAKKAEQVARGRAFLGKLGSDDFQCFRSASNSMRWNALVEVCQADVMRGGECQQIEAHQTSSFTISGVTTRAPGGTGNRGIPLR